MTSARQVFIGVVVAAQVALVGAGHARAAPLTMADVLAGLDDRHPLLLAARERRVEADGERRAAGGAFDVSWRTRAKAAPLGTYDNARVDTELQQPTTLWGSTFFGGYRWGSDDVAIYDGKATTNDGGELRLGAQVPLWRDGPIDRRRANLARAAIGQELATLALAQQRIELVRLASQRYWTWIAAGRRLGLARGLLATAMDRDDGLGERVARGDLPEIDRLDNQRLILQRRQHVIAANMALERAALELSLYLRDDRGDVVVPGPDRLVAELPQPTALPVVDERVISDALGRRPEVAAAHRRAERAGVEARWARNQAAPALDLQIAGSRDVGAGPEARREFELEASVVLEIPLQRNVARGREAAASAQRGAAEQEVRFARDRVRQELESARTVMAAAAAQFGEARAELALARRVEDGERRKLALGDSSLLLLNLRETATLEAAMRELGALVDHQLGHVAWEAARGDHATAP